MEQSKTGQQERVEITEQTEILYERVLKALFLARECGRQHKAQGGAEGGTLGNVTQNGS